MKKLLFLKMLAIAVVVACISSFTVDKTTSTESGYYYFYYEGITHDHKWVYISAVESGERPGDNLTVPSPENRKHFINRVKSQYESQATASDKFYIEDKIEYEFKADKEDLIDAKNKHLETLRENNYKVFNVKL